jgi:hypothetical protein
MNGEARPSPDIRNLTVVDAAFLGQQAELVELRHQSGQALEVLEAILAPWEGVIEHPAHVGFHHRIDNFGRDCELCLAWARARTQHKILLDRRRRMGKAFPLSVMEGKQVKESSA